MPLRKVEEACDLLDKDSHPAFSTYEVMTYVAIANADFTCQQIIEREEKKNGDKNLINMITHLKETIDLHCFDAWRFSGGSV